MKEDKMSATMEIKFTGSDPTEVRQLLIKAAGDFLQYGIMSKPGGGLVGQPLSSSSVSPPPVALPEEAPQKPRGRPKAAAPAEPVKPVVEPPPSIIYSKEELIKALADVCDKHGIDRGRACLTACGVSKVGELKQNRHGEFMQACREAMAEEPKEKTEE